MLDFRPNPGAWEMRREGVRGPCGCRRGSACEYCITDDEIDHIQAYGVLCSGPRYCDHCFDPDLHLSGRQR